MQSKKFQGRFRGRLMVYNLLSVFAMGFIALGLYIPLSLTGMDSQGFGSYALFYGLLPLLLHLLSWGIFYSLLQISEKPEHKDLAVLSCMASHSAIFMIVFGKFSAVYLLASLPVLVSGGFGSRKLTGRVLGVSMLFSLLGSLIPWVDGKTYDTGLLINLLVVGGLLLLSYRAALILVSLSVQHEKNMNQSKSRQDELKHRLMTDQLTRLFNHTAFCQFMNQEFDKFLSQNITCTLAVIDIDNFKSVNDTYGHENGNIVLKNLAKILQATAGQAGYVCRYGGEEFTILFPGMNGEEARLIMEKARSRFAASRYPFLGEGKITFSCGLQEAYKGLRSAGDMIKKADKAMYDAKRSGKNQCVVGLKLYERAV